MARGLVAWRLAGLVACALAAAASGARASSLDGAPVSQSPPNLTGAAQQSQTMTVDAGGWAGHQPLFTYQWQGDRADGCGAPGGADRPAPPVCVRLAGGWPNPVRVRVRTSRLRPAPALPGSL